MVPIILGCRNPLYTALRMYRVDSSPCLPHSPDCQSSPGWGETGSSLVQGPRVEYQQLASLLLTIVFRIRLFSPTVDCDVFTEPEEVSVVLCV